MGALQDMLETQSKLQFEFDPRARTEDPQQTCEYIKDMCTALTAETVELLEETGWKPWTTSWHVNLNEARAEWIDAWHFLLNLANRLEMDEEMIVEKYNVKAEINLQRIRNSYDGVTTKCPGCRRAMDDPATTCRWTDFSGDIPTRAWCAMEERSVSRVRS